MGLLAAAGLVRQKPHQRQQGRSRHRRRERRDVQIGPRRNGYTAERVAAAVRATRGRAGRTARRHGRRARRCVPLIAGSNSNNGVPFRASRPGRTRTPTRSYNEISPGYFPHVGVPLLAGRDFTRADVVGAPKVAIVNEAFARKFKMGSDVVGKRMSRSAAATTSRWTSRSSVSCRNANYSDVKQIAFRRSSSPVSSERSNRRHDVLCEDAEPRPRSC